MAVKLTKLSPYNPLGEKQTSRRSPEGAGPFASTIWLCAHTFKALGRDFSENSFENDKILHNNDPQQLFLEILGTV